MPVLELGSGSTMTTSKRPEDYHVRFMPVCALADVFVDLVPPDREIKHRIYGDFLVADGQLLPFKHGAFDEIYARHIIEHVPDYMRLLQECCRVLTENGKLYIYTPNYFSKYATCKRPLSRETDPSHIHVFTNMRLAVLLKRIGFRIVALKSQLATYYPVPTRLKWILNFLFAEEVSMVATK